MTFRSVSNPEHGDFHYRGTLSQSDPTAVEVDELKSVLEEVLTIAAIERSPQEWRTAEDIAAETRIPVDRVQEVLQGSDPDVMKSDQVGPDGLQRYTTFDHFVRAERKRRYSSARSSA